MSSILSTRGFAFTLLVFIKLRTFVPFVTFLLAMEAGYIRVSWNIFGSSGMGRAIGTIRGFLGSDFFSHLQSVVYTLRSIHPPFDVVILRHFCTSEYCLKNF